MKWMDPERWIELKDLDLIQELLSVLNKIWALVPEVNLGGPEFFYLIGFAIGTAIFAVGLCLLFLPALDQWFSKLRTSLKIQRNREWVNLHIPDILKTETQRGKIRFSWYENWIEEAGPRLSKAQLKITATKYTLIMFSCSVIGALIGLILLKNVTAAILLAVAAILIPDQFTFRRIEKLNQKYTAQLAVAARMLSAEFTNKPSVQQAMEAVANQLQEPLKSVFKRTADDLNAGLGPDVAFARMLKSLDFDLGREFVQALRVAYDEIAVRPMFSKLAVKINNVERLKKTNDNTLIWMKSMGILLNILVIPSYFFMSMIVPETNIYLTTTPIGKFIVSIVFMSMLIGLLLDRALQKIDL